ncbi:MAG: lysophospholipid acyltransferase family protein [Gammaproteobacteria bacterium]
MQRDTWRYRLATATLPFLVRHAIKLLWMTCRIERVIGEKHIAPLLQSSEPFIPCYWHQRQVFCVRYLLDQRAKGLNLGYLISPSADGDMASRMFGDIGVHIIRGSATRGGAQALREIYTMIKTHKVSPIVTPDGPNGPIFEFKQGVVMLSQLAGAPMLPIAYGANRYWQVKSWDRFVVPKPFARITISIGPPQSVDRRLAVGDLSAVCGQMAKSLNELVAGAEAAAKQP